MICGQEEYDYWWASMQNGLGRNMKQIAEMAGGTAELYQMNVKRISEIPGMSKGFAAYINNRRNAWKLEVEYDKMRQAGIEFVPWNHPKYPRKLRQISDPPFALFVRGKLPEEKESSVAVIGARDCSAYGRIMAEHFGRELAEQGIQVVSGMAYGIDGIAQSAALQAGESSFGVLGCGVDICYPASNRSLYSLLQEQGGLISEYCPGTSPISRLFPMRNRIISGLSDVVLVVEARLKSGTLITVDQALEQGREIMAVPGRLTDPLSTGCNSLIRQGAQPVLDINDIMILLGKKNEKNIKKTQKEKIKLESMEKLVYTCTDLYAKNLEEIASRVPCTISELLHILVSLELKGLIREVSRNYYVRTGKYEQ